MDERKILILPAPRTDAPPHGESVMVISRRFRCRGYVDTRGVWHHDTDGTPIDDVIGWLPFD